ncbi:senescence-associated protein OSA15, chloroplastic isoform X2 [Phragmites australis]|uniref:senescence-associated protein OSA15, chloroplastic isoform X2 n=1 Tax=Phragmites australis TaxID=29695 RepID=UPI002D76E446|nr:senescence-associated protein OSA15, chloroplastic isoform X2 [Phragmites australis]
MASNMYGTVAACRVCYSDQYGMPQKLKGLGLTFLNCVPQKLEVRRWINGYHLVFRLCPNDRHWQTNGKSNCSLVRQGCNVRCHSYGSHNSSETKDSKISEDCTNPYRDFEQHSRGSSQFPDDQVASKKKSAYASQGLADACKFVYNDAKFVNERAQSDILLLSRLNKRACQDVAVLGLGFLKLDARARKDTQKIDHSVKERAACLNDFARALKERAESDLKKAADQHWSDGALEADLRRANLVVKRRAMEDAFMALKFVRDIHDMMVNRLYEQLPKDGSSRTNSIRFITLERNGKTLELFPGEVSADQINAIEEAYWSMASAFSEADGIDYTDPEELELLVATLIDLDAMDGKRSVSLISECSSSPDVNTRKALANALATAPSMWTLGNAGMGALQRLAQDSNYAVARAASRAIDELKKQWELEEGDSLRFVMNQNLAAEKTDDDNSGADDTT